jgi:aryl-alcohol dehydrogenase-like predicted oxidoreductase
MARGEGFDADLARARELESRLDEFGARDLPELAFRFARAETRIPTILIGFSDLAQLESALRYEAAGPLAPAAMATLQARPSAV